jgi:lipoprotein-anchoring transpeptidase ErfK/SrfK
VLLEPAACEPRTVSASPLSIRISLAEQRLELRRGGSLLKSYAVSTAKNGAGERSGSHQTPRGRHLIRAKIGAGAPIGTVFRGRRPTGEIYSEELARAHPGRDWILTRILWLSGLEVGKNRLGDVDTMRRYIYIHGAPDSAVLGVPGSIGCVRMANAAIVELFDLVPAGTPVEIA